MAWKHVKLGEQDWHWVPVSDKEFSDEYIDSVSSSLDAKYLSCPSNNSCEPINDLLNEPLSTLKLREKEQIHQIDGNTLFNDFWNDTNKYKRVFI